MSEYNLHKESAEGGEVKIDGCGSGVLISIDPVSRATAESAEVRLRLRVQAGAVSISLDLSEKETAELRRLLDC